MSNKQGMAYQPTDAIKVSPVSSLSSTSRRNYILVTLAVFYIGFNYVQPLLVHFIGGELVGQLGRIFSALLIIMSLKDFLTRPLLGRYALFLFALIIVWGISALANLATSAPTSSIYDLLSTVAIYIVFVNLCEHYGHSTRIIVIALTIFAFFNILVALASLFTGQSLFISKTAAGSFGFDPLTGRITGFRGENYVGLWTAPLLAFSLFSLYYPRHRIASLTIPVIFAAIAVSLSRTSILASLVVVLVWAAIVFRNKSRLLLIVLIAVLVIPSVWLASKALTSQFRLMDVTVVQSETKRLTIDNRSSAWSYWFGIAADNPLGIGPGSIQTMIKGGRRSVPHNSLLDVLVEYGVLGFLLYCIPWCLTLRSFIWLFKKNHYDYDMAILIAAIAGMFISLLLLSNPLMKIVFLMAGCIEGRRKYLIAQQTRA